MIKKSQLSTRRETTDNQFDERPHTKDQTLMHQNPKPEKLFSKLKKIDRSTIEEIVDFQEQRDKCKSLVNTLNLYTNPSIHLEPAFSYDANQSLQRRRNTLNQLKDPNYIPNSKFLDASQVLQLAYLDKIIEECDEDNFRKET